MVKECVISSTFMTLVKEEDVLFFFFCILTEQTDNKEERQIECKNEKKKKKMNYEFVKSEREKTQTDAHNWALRRVSTSIPFLLTFSSTLTSFSKKSNRKKEEEPNLSSRRDAQNLNISMFVDLESKKMAKVSNLFEMSLSHSRQQSCSLFFSHWKLSPIDRIVGKHFNR